MDVAETPGKLGCRPTPAFSGPLCCFEEQLWAGTKPVLQQAELASSS